MNNIISTNYTPAPSTYSCSHSQAGNKMVVIDVGPQTDHWLKTWHHPIFSYMTHGKNTASQQYVGSRETIFCKRNREAIDNRKHKQNWSGEKYDCNSVKCAILPLDLDKLMTWHAGFERYRRKKLVTVPAVLWPTWEACNAACFRNKMPRRLI